MPGIRRRSKIAAERQAIVFPAETKASASPFFTMRIPTRMDEFSLARTSSE